MLFVNPKFSIKLRPNKGISEGFSDVEGFLVIAKVMRNIRINERRATVKMNFFFREGVSDVCFS